MGMFSGFNRKHIQEELNVKIALSKLQFLASCMENNTDKPTDLKHWQENITILSYAEAKKAPYLSFVQEVYEILYKLYLQKHHPELSHDLTNVQKNPSP